MKQEIKYYIKQKKGNVQLFLGPFGEFLASHQKEILINFLHSLTEDEEVLEFYFETSQFQYKKVNLFLVDKGFNFEQFDCGNLLNEKAFYGFCTKNYGVDLLLSEIWPYHRLLFLVKKQDLKLNTKPTLLQQAVNNKIREVPSFLLDTYETVALEFFHGEFLEVRSKKFSSKKIFGQLEDIADYNNIMLNRANYDDF